MRTLLLLTALVISNALFSQCDITAGFSSGELMCNQVFITNTSSIDCPDATFIVEKLRFGSGVLIEGEPVYTMYDSLLYNGPVEDLGYVLWNESSIILVCLTINEYDAEYNLIATDQHCEYIDLPVTPDICSLSSTPTSGCAVSDGTITVTICGDGAPPYTLVAAGLTFTSLTEEYVMTGVPAGIHTVSVMTEGGCMGWGGPVIVAAEPTSLQGFVFSDDNGNNSLDDDEVMLGGQEFHMIDVDATAMSGADGYIQFPEVPEGIYSFEYVSDDGSYEYANGLITLVGSAGCLLFGLVPQDISVFDAYPADIWSSNIHCVNGYNPGLHLDNNGTIPLNGTLTVTFDPMFTIDYLTGAVPYSTSTPGEVTFDIEDQAGSTAFNYKFHVNGPGVSNIGETFPFVLHLVLTNEFGAVIYDETWNSEPMIICGYDPNDKQSIPVGYTDEHFVLAGDQIEYRIRFQNTGNAPAEDIVVEDQLDTEHLDLSSFEPVMASHAYTTSIDAVGLVHFTFNDIMLPDSASDEPGSQGYVVYRINTKDDLAEGVEINNTANIYFDTNPPITTNTTWHRILSCEPEFAIGGISLCEGNDFNWDFSRPYFETEISINDEFYSNDGEVFLESPEAGATYHIIYTYSNELCYVTHLFALNVVPIPTGNITTTGNVLHANGEAGAQYQWFFEGEIIEGATDESYTASESGNYSVEITTFGGCALLTDDFSFTVGINEFAFTAASLYPNPMIQTAKLLLPGRDCDVLLTDIYGRVVRKWNKINGILVIDREELVSGLYTVSVKDGGGASQELKLVITGD